MCHIGVAAMPWTHVNGRKRSANPRLNAVRYRTQGSDVVPNTFLHTNVVRMSANTEASVLLSLSGSRRMIASRTHATFLTALLYFALLPQNAVTTKCFLHTTESVAQGAFRKCIAAPDVPIPSVKKTKCWCTTLASAVLNAKRYA